MSLRRLAMLTVLLGCLCAPAAYASPEQASIMMDDDQLLYRNNVTQTRTLVTMRSMGVDAVRATVLWRIVAEGADLTNKEIERIKGEKNRAKARAQRVRFKATDPRTYPTRNWDRYDNLVKEATKLGMRVYFTITGPGPELRAQDRAHQPAQERRHVPALPVAVSQLRRGGRQALLGHLPRRERDSQGAAARLAVVAVERAQPAGLAVAAVGEGRRPQRARRAVALPRAAPGRRPGPRALRPRQRPDPARRARPAGLGQDGPAQRAPARPVPARDALPQARRHAVRRRRRGAAGAARTS